MNILIIGNGGREHAIAWKISREPTKHQIFVAPGNAGTALEKNTTNIPINVLEIDKLIVFAKENKIDLTIVGPEIPLAAGIVDTFQKKNLLILGPTQAASKIESSKIYSKELMEQLNIPTAKFQCFTNANDAKQFAEELGLPVVIKADGLAAGKGVIIAKTTEEVHETINAILIEKKFGNAGSQIIIEEFLTGEEASFIILTDGSTILPFPTCQDHKTRDNGDKGPNTGGLGAYSPAPILTPSLQNKIIETMIQPILSQLKTNNTPYCGFLYAGVIIDRMERVSILEFNCRLGDPETQVILMRLTSSLSELCMAACSGTLDKAEAKWDSRTALGVVMAAGGYPDKYRKGDMISGISQQEREHTKIFHAGTKLKSNNHIATCGGRVLCASSLGKTIAEAQEHAYQSVSHIKWPNCYYRTDIGDKALAYLNKNANIEH